MKDIASALRPPFEIQFSPQLKVRYGYRDAHVELEAKVAWLPLGKFKKSFTPEEFTLGKSAFDKARLWCEIPEHQRGAIAPAQPFIENLSDRIAMYYGYADGHAELVIKVVVEDPDKKPGFGSALFGALAKKLPKEFRQEFSQPEILSAQEAFTKADRWSALTETERAKLGAS